MESVKTKWGPIQWFVHDKHITSPVLLPMMNPDDFNAATFEWTSWLWQRKHMPPQFLKTTNPRILPVLDCANPKTLLETCARKALWKLTRSEVLDLAGLKHMSVPQDTQFVRSVLGAVQFSDSRVHCICVVQVLLKLQQHHNSNLHNNNSISTSQDQQHHNSAINYNSSSLKKEHFQQLKQLQQYSRTKASRPKQIAPISVIVLCCRHVWVIALGELVFG